MTLRLCQVCSRECRPLRCSKCRQAYYCSVECQKADWKAGHRRVCRGGPSLEKAERAFKELYSLTQGISIGAAKEQFERASDLVLEQKKEEKQKREKLRASPKSVVEEQAASPLESRDPVSQEFLSERKQCLLFIVEEMKHIFQFKATLRPSIDSQQWMKSDEFQLSVKTNRDSDNSMIKFHHKDDIMFTAILPRRLIPDQCSWRMDDNDTTISLHLKFEEPVVDHDLAPLETTHVPDLINELECRYCEQPLLKDRPIKQAHLLPQGNWDEIADYLICYSGQPIVDFSSSSEARRTVALQDANALSFHHLDLGTSVCVLAVAGYGEAEDHRESKMEVDGSAVVRGSRSWRDSSGGASICCSHCCSPLGFASMESPETYRLMKHRLLVGGGGTKQELSSCASFLAREMVRYAESKAIFTFIVGVNDVGSSTHASTKKCLLLRLVSWDTNIATKVLGNGRLQFRKVVKLVFEETVDKFELSDNDDATKWMWGGVDLCCLPLGADGSSTTTNDRLGDVSTVRLSLPPDEYKQVHNDMVENSNLFARAVTDATIMMRMGMETSRENLGLTAISL
eukprot:scaffold24732_cov162-Cylindrotheca_fusiformis.AAC.3